ncbi:DUF4376 domain-containing protein [Agrobacterium rhizogenes]|nr:DUF4376 domain-containing protein [Rhizobium rhizogenes]
MTKYFARLVDGVVVETTAVDDNQKIVDLYHPDIAKLFVSCGSSVQQGYLYDGKTFSAPVIPEITPDDLLTYAATKRYAVETGGITVDGSKVATDRQSQALITGAYNYVQANPDVTVTFKTSVGFVELTAAQMMAIANAVAAHVQASFAAESEIIAEISAGTIKATADIDAFAWPTI